MMASSFVRHAIGTAAAAAIVAGCGQTLTPQSGFSGTSGFTTAAHSRAPLLYVIREGTVGNQKHVGVSILTFPKGERIAKLTGRGDPAGICSDAAGNLWITFLRGGNWYVDEFAHGASKPIAELLMPKGAFAAGCAVDSSSGNLAVMNRSGTYQGSVDVWPGAKEGKPIVYTAPFIPINGAYDDAGNLFIDGTPGGSTFSLVLGELPNGSGTIDRISLDKPVEVPGGVQWDGKYVAVETGGFANHRPRIYRVQVSGSVGTVIGAVYAKRLWNAAPFVIYRGELIGQAGLAGKLVGLWRYPGGGKATKFFPQENQINGVAISK